MRPYLFFVLALVVTTSTSCIQPADDLDIATTSQSMRCQTCGGDGGGGPTYGQAMGAMSDYVWGTYSARGVEAGCDSIEIGGSTAYSCWVAFNSPFDGRRYTAQCTVADNTEADGATIASGCSLTPSS